MTEMVMFRPGGDKGDVTIETGQCNVFAMRLLLLLAPLLLFGCDTLNDTVASSAPAAEPKAAGKVEAESDRTLPLSGAESGTARRTVASLGDPGRAGMWLETPLVQKETPGRVRVVSSGVSASVTLIPIKGAATAGSRLSLAAMRGLDAPLGDLIQLEVTIGK
ncbi:hypothetical protein [Pontibaca salina]|uniref:D-galactarate dehydratase n=1 Tax=Pontibaca salina TaxID=2795731 RepID=A0A934M3R5_9RHOB|nr:hypothetical protein [Pontibaca salina]MBI6630134.1 hypothetical protein [Pontibaca salina]